MQGTLFDLTGRVALVTGGSRGLGLAMAREFAGAGAEVIITSRHEAQLQEAVASFAEPVRGRVHYLLADMTDRGAVANLAERATALRGRVDILVNNAGGNLPQAIDEVTDPTWDEILELNLSSCMALTRALVPGMKQHRWGRILFISSIMGLASKQGRASYSATKSALIGLARAVALDLGPWGITANCLAPGPFLTDLPGQLLSEAEKRQFAERTALGRWGDPRELAGPALLLVSEAGSYITGTTLTVDGGTLVKTF